MSSPCREKILCLRTWMKIYKSPGGPPRLPASPPPLMRRRESVSTPAGIFTSILRSRSMRPEPPQPGQRSLINVPVPPQASHDLTLTKRPKAVTLCGFPAAPLYRCSKYRFPVLFPVWRRCLHIYHSFRYV